MNNWERVHRRSFSDETSAYRVEFPKGATVADLIAHALTRTGEHGRIDIVRPHPWLGLAVACSLEYRYGKIEADNIPEEYKTEKLKSVAGYGGYSLMDYNITLKL